MFAAPPCWTGTAGLDDGDPVPHAGSGTRIGAGGSVAACDLKKRPTFDAVTAARVPPT